MVPPISKRARRSSSTEVEEEEDDFEEIDHAKEDDDDDDDEIVNGENDSRHEEEAEGEDIADQIELIEDKMGDFNFDEAAENGPSSLIKSDIYFMAHSSKSKISKQSYAAILEKFDLYETDIKKIVDKEHRLLCKEFNIQTFSDSELLKFYHLLKADFNIIFYGFGSKRDILIEFAKKFLKSYHYVTVHGYMELIKLTDIIGSLNKAIGIESDSVVSNEAELINLLKEFFADRDFFLLVHSIDILYLKNGKVRKFIDNLVASVPRVRLLATVDHINSPLLWSLTESSTYRWLWFHVATFSPYLVERKHSSSQSSIFTTGSKSWKQSTNLLAVKQVYNSVNSNAQKIFLMILKLYMESRSRNSTFTFYSLYLSCREEFLVNSEVTLREHLAEFKYHNLIKMTKASDGAESIQVIIDKETVKRFNDSVGEEWKGNLICLKIAFFVIIVTHMWFSARTL